MNTLRFATIAVCATGALGVAALHQQHSRADARRTPRRLPPVDIATYGESNLVAGYREWTKVNAKPEKILSWIAYSCLGPTAQQVAEEAGNPHNDRYITVYVNSIGKRAMLSARNPRFPAGSIVVKEKLTHAYSRTPELLTVMRKRNPGYDPLKGDWEYLVYDGAGTQIQARGPIQKCQGCHAKWYNTDYISRSYLTAAQWSRLR